MDVVGGAVVDAAIGWLVQSVLGSFFNGMMKAWARDVGLAEDVENLESEMRNVQMVLAAAEGRRIQNKPLAQSLHDLKDLLYDAEDVMDELDYYRLQQQIEQGVGSTNPEKSIVSSSTPSIFQRAYSTASRVVSWASHGRKRKREEEPIHCTMLPYEIKLDISERIKGIVNFLHKLGNSVREVLHLEISTSIVMRNQNQYVARNARLTTSVPIEDKVYGRDAERDKIVELLINRKSKDLQVLPIVGIGGIGKTTLARFVYGDQRIKHHFELRVWVCVSTNFDKVRLTREILEHVCPDRLQYGNITNFNVLQGILQKNIENKRFLLVFDDMWEEKDRNGWISLLAPLKHNHVPGCMILSTTRIPCVAKMIGTMDPVQVDGLDEKDFWQFFKACAFGNENHEGHPTLHSIGQQIVKALKGCPLAARSVGAVLNRNVSYEHWRTVRNKWKYLQEDADDIIPILKLSYDFLPVHLQHCFSYCSLFPEDYRFDVEDLVHAWISQNFVQCDDPHDPTKRLEEIGKQYMDDLVDLGFFQKVDDSHHVMHDLMHELAQMVSLNECATITGSKLEAIRPSVRHISIIHYGFHYMSEHFLSKKFEEIVENIGSLIKLRTLMVFGQSSICLLKFLLTLCKKSKSLRVVRIYVTLTHDDINSMLNLLSPYHLRYLEFSPTIGYQFIIALPQALTKLYHLQFLDVRNGCNISVPTDMNNLVNLRKLDVANEKAVLLAMAGVGKLTSLQRLAFKVQNVGKFEIKQLQSMNNLVTLKVSQLENVKTKEEASGARLIDKVHLEALSLSWSGISMGHVACTAGRTEDVLEGLQPHDGNLKSLCITRYRGAIPTWLAINVPFMNLQSLHLENCSEWQILPSLKMLLFLRKLKLIRMWKLMEISIPSLEELVLIDMPKLKKCLGTYGKELTSHLRVMIIKDCPQLNEITVFRSCSSFLAEQQSWYPFLSILAICYCPHIIKWEILPLGGMQALKELELTDLHLVRDLSVPSLEKLVLIKMLSLERCSGLTAPPLLPSQEEQEVCLSSLHRLVIHDCPCLIVSCPLPPSACIRTQREISIRGKLSIIIDSSSVNIESSEFNVLDDQVLMFHNLRDITWLSIRNCPKLISISSEALSQLTGLVDLSIVNCPNLLKPPITLEAASENSSCENIPTLPSLKHLEVSSSGVAGGWLTKMLSHLRSLEELILRDCPQIKWLWISQSTETEASTSLASATTLYAEDQTLLKVPSNILCSLKKLTISATTQLGALDGLQFLTSLRGLGIGLNPELSAAWDRDPKLQEPGQGGNQIGLLPPSITTLGISNLTNNVQSRLLSCLPVIIELRVWQSPELTSLQLGHCTALTELEISDCESLASIEGFQFLTNLRSFTIAASSSLPPWMELLLQQQGACEVLSRLTDLEIWDASVLTMSLCQQLTSLQCLKFNGKETSSMVSLTEEQERALQLLTSLQELEFWSYPNLLLLPADLRSLASLKYLGIYSCPSISRLPEMAPSCRLYVHNCSVELSLRFKQWEERRREMTNDKFVHY